MIESLERTVRAAIESGEWAELAAGLEPTAVMRTSNESGRRRISGAEAIAEHLGAPGPGEISEWEAREWEGGLALSFQWQGGGSIDRRRWYVLRGPGGGVREIWSSAARPNSAGGEAHDPPEALLGGLGSVSVEPLSHGGNSGASLLRSTSADGTSHILKLVRPGADWLARVTADEGRTGQLHEAGAFERMPGSIEHGIVAVERDGAGAWVAMRDVGGLLLGDEVRLSRDRSRTVLTAAAAMHSTFKGEVPAGAATLEARLGMSSPAVAAAEREGPDLLPKQFEHAWEAFATLIPPDVCEPVLGLVADPAPLADALRDAYGGTTLIHGDLRDDNLGFDGERLVLIDWDLATAGTPGVELAWYLAQDAWRIEASRDEIVDDHRQAQGEAFVAEELELGLISGLVQYGWLLAHSARVHPDPAEREWGAAELNWWVPRVATAFERVGDRL